MASGDDELNAAEILGSVEDTLSDKRIIDTIAEISRLREEEAKTKMREEAENEAERDAAEDVLNKRDPDAVEGVRKRRRVADYDSGVEEGVVDDESYSARPKKMPKRLHDTLIQTDSDVEEIIDDADDSHPVVKVTTPLPKRVRELIRTEKGSPAVTKTLLPTPHASPRLDNDKMDTSTTKRLVVKFTRNNEGVISNPNFVKDPKHMQEKKRKREEEDDDDDDNDDESLRRARKIAKVLR